MVPYLLSLALVTTGCKRPPQAAPEAQAAEVRGSASITDDPASLEALRLNFERVHFALDSSTLTADARAALDANARILVEHPRVSVEIQGHADERGTVDYNLALGQRRALSVREYLSGRGVAAGRLDLVSYGEERPLERGQTEVAHAANRRAEFRVLEGSAQSVGTVR